MLFFILGSVVVGLFKVNPKITLINFDYLAIKKNTHIYQNPDILLTLAGTTRCCYQLNVPGPMLAPEPPCVSPWVPARGRDRRKPSIRQKRKRKKLGR